MKSKKKQIKDLWKIAFNDSDKFIRLYFKLVYKDENALVIDEDGRVVSALQMIPYTMTYYGEEISVAYISGACTLPSEQGKGLMTKLLHNAFEEMRRRNIAVTALIPAEKWLFDYYRKQGYTETFEYSMKVYTRHEYIEPERDLRVTQVEDPDPVVYSYFDRKLRERPAGILHSIEDFNVILEDFKLSKGRLFVAYNYLKEPVGISFVLPPDKCNTPKSVLVKEILYDDERVKKHLLYESTRKFKVPKAVYRIPFKDSLITYPFGMARAMDTDRLIKIWTKNHPDSKISTDKMRNMDIQTLTSHLFDYENKMAYMSLMLD